MRSSATNACLLLGLVLFLLPVTGPAKGSGSPVTVTDDLGRKIILNHSVARIISLAPSVTEILYAVGAGGKVVGDTVYCDYPPPARRLPHVGGMIDPSTEKIVALRPDLVIVSDETISPANADQLSARYHAPVFVTAAGSYSSVIEDIRTLGAIAGDTRDTDSAINVMQSLLARVQNAIKGRARPRVFVVKWEKPLMTASGRSFIGDLVRLAGGTNVAEKEPGLPYPVYSEENLVIADPDVILMTGDGDKVQQSTAPSLSRLKLRAIRGGHVYAIPSAWTDRPGPRLGLGLEAIVRLLHPDAMMSAAAR